MYCQYVFNMVLLEIKLNNQEEKSVGKRGIEQDTIRKTEDELPQKGSQGTLRGGKRREEKRARLRAARKKTHKRASAFGTKEK